MTKHLEIASTMPLAYRFSGFELDCRTRDLRRGHRSIAMPARCFECLHHLILMRERAVSRDELAQAVFGRTNVSDAQLGQVVLRARRVLGDDGHKQSFIRTVPRYGFRWLAEVEEIETSSEPLPTLPPKMSASPQRHVQYQSVSIAVLVVAAAAWVLFGKVPFTPPLETVEQALVESQEDFAAGRNQHGLVVLDHMLEAQGSRLDVRGRARALVQRGRFEIRLGRHADAERDFSSAILLLDAEADPVLLGRAYNGRGVAQSALGMVGRARQDFGRARVLLTRKGELRSVAWVDSNLGMLRRRSVGLRDSQGAGDGVSGAHPLPVEPTQDPIEELDTFLGDASGEGLSGRIRHLATEVELAAHNREQLEWPQAQRHAARAWALRSETRAAEERSALVVGVAKTLLGSGRLRDARALLADSSGLTHDDGRLDALRAELAWRSGDSATALAFADRALSSATPDTEPAELLRMQRQRLELVSATDAPLRGRITAPPREDESVDAWVVRALAAQSHGLALDAGTAYRQALARAEEDHSPAQVVAVAKSYLPWLIDQRAFAQTRELVDRLSGWTAHDYDAALVVLSAAQATGDWQRARAAALNARRLAGERWRPILPDASLTRPGPSGSRLPSAIH